LRPLLRRVGFRRVICRFRFCSRRRFVYVTSRLRRLGIRSDLGLAATDEVGRLLAPLRQRVTLAGCNDETLCRLAAADGRLSIGFNPAFHLDWVPLSRRRELSGQPGLDGWLNRTGAQSLPARLAALRDLVPDAHELHLRLETLERLPIEGVTDAVEQLHAHGWAVDVWTLDEGMMRWHARMHAAVAAGVDMITTTTAPILARAFRGGA